MRKGTQAPVESGWFRGQALMVVDTYCMCEYYRVIIARRMDIPQQGWVILLAIRPTAVGFGDYLDYNYISRKVHLLRGPVLRFKLHIADMPAAFAAKVVRTFPFDDLEGPNMFLYPNLGEGLPDYE